MPVILTVIPRRTGVLAGLPCARLIDVVALPDDPAMVERDPDVVLGWLAQRVHTRYLPAEPVVLELWPHEHRRRYWLVLQKGLPPYACLTDPLLDTGRYVYLRCSLATLLALARSAGLAQRSRTAHSPQPALRS